MCLRLSRETGSKNLSFCGAQCDRLGINQLLMWFCVDILGIFYMISKIGATAVVMVYNFVTRKMVLEKK